MMMIGQYGKSVSFDGASSLFYFRIGVLPYDGESQQQRIGKFFVFYFFVCDFISFSFVCVFVGKNKKAASFSNVYMY